MNTAPKRPAAAALRRGPAVSGGGLALRDLASLSFEALTAHRMRYGLSALAVGVGVAAVVLLASIGEGTRRYIAGQLTQFGSTLVSVNPGKTTTGGVTGMVGGSARKLTLDDARALERVPGVVAVMPCAYGSANVEFANRGRRVFVYGITGEAPRVWSWTVSVGQFLPGTDWERASPVAVLGVRLKHELFGDANALGHVVRIGETRFRVIGLMQPKGQYLGFDLDDAAFIPVTSALRLFNLPELTEIDLLAGSADVLDAVARDAEALMKERHDGQEDVTVMTQAEGMQMVNRILGILTAVVTGIAAISLLVGAIGILTVMWIVVHERESEIGLVKALGATRGQILVGYLAEALATSVAGGGAGLAAGAGGAWLLGAVVPGLSTWTPPWIVIASLGLAIAVGLGAGVLPALRAAALDPIEALRAE